MVKLFEKLSIKHIKVKSTGQLNRVTEIPDELSDEWELIKEETSLFTPDIDPKIYDLTAESIEDNFENKIGEMLNDTNYRLVLVIRNLDFFGNFNKANDGWHFKKSSEAEKY